MPAGSIPVSMLTHLNVAFGYIDPSSYKISAMDGISSDIYRNIGNVKAQNTNLKISIAIGGWTFTDPGAYRSVFTTMVSSPSLRSTFINNLLGFLEEYGYDGVGKCNLQHTLRLTSSITLKISFRCVDFSRVARGLST